MHKFLSEYNNNDLVDDVYITKSIFNKDFDEQISHPKISKNGNKYITLKVRDKSLASQEYIQVLYFYKNDADIDELKEGNPSRSQYIKITGSFRIDEQNRASIFANKIICANNNSNITFNTSDFYDYDENIRLSLLSYAGLSNVPLRHTISKVFQDDPELVDRNSKFTYKRIYGSPYDDNQINVFIDGIDETFNIPAYITPTMAKLIDEGYKFEIRLDSVTDVNQKSGIRVNIKGKK